MSKAVAQPVREAIVAQYRTGTPLTQVAAALSMPYRTVRGIVRRYRTRGSEGLAPDYQRCAQPGTRFPKAVYEAALQLRREHRLEGNRLGSHDDPRPVSGALPQR